MIRKLLLFGILGFSLSMIQEMEGKKVSLSLSKKTKAQITKYKVILTDAGTKKIEIIKIIREVTSLGLKESYDLVKGVPKTIKDGISIDEAFKIKSAIENAGGKVTIIEKASGQVIIAQKPVIAAPATQAPAVAGGGAVAGRVAVAGGAAAPSEPQTEYDVELTDAGTKKLEIIKIIREFTSLGLKEAKDVVDGAPKTIKVGISKDEAAKIKSAIESAGGRATIK